MPGDSPAPRVDFALHPCKILESAAAVTEHDFARLGEDHPGSAPLEHRLPDQLLEVQDLAVDCRRGYVQALRGFADGA